MKSKTNEINEHTFGTKDIEVRGHKVLSDTRQIQSNQNY
jgi:hypothetical protein